MLIALKKGCGSELVVHACADQADVVTDFADGADILVFEADIEAFNACRHIVGDGIINTAAQSIAVAPAG